MRRFFLMLIPLALIAVGVLWPVVIRPSSEASAADDPVVFSNYDVDLIVSAGGRLDAVETITAEFPSGRHGLFKYWAVDNQNDPGVRQTPEVTSILLDGQRGALPDALGGRRAILGRQDRRSGRIPQLRHARLRDPLQHRRRPRPRQPQAPTRSSPTRPAKPPNRRPSSIGTSSRRRGTTRSNGPTSRSPCPVRSAARSAPWASASVGPAMI